MKTEHIIQKLSDAVGPGQLFVNEKMLAHTTFRVGGEADIFVEINDRIQLEKVLAILKSENLCVPNRDFYLIGNGSNLLVSDKGLRGIVLHLSKEYSHIAVNGNTLVCEAGCTLAAIARKAYECALTGFEFAAGIPGSLGGAIVMNAGAYDGEMKQVVKSVRMMTPDAKIIEKSAEEMRFSYRHSIVKEQELIVLDVTIELLPGNQTEIRKKMDELALKRRDKQPLEYPSAGSTFKRPEGYFAAKLIDDAGLRGFTVGGAQVSEKHCGFVINKSDATASDIYKLICEVQKRVKETSGVTIEPEVILLGEF